MGFQLSFAGQRSGTIFWLPRVHPHTLRYLRIFIPHQQLAAQTFNQTTWATAVWNSNESPDSALGSTHSAHDTSRDAPHSPRICVWKFFISQHTTCLCRTPWGGLWPYRSLQKETSAQHQGSSLTPCSENAGTCHRGQRCSGSEMTVAWRYEVIQCKGHDHKMTEGQRHVMNDPERRCAFNLKLYVCKKQKSTKQATIFIFFLWYLFEIHFSGHHACWSHLTVSPCEHTLWDHYR